MDKTIAGLLGAVGALAATVPAQAATVPQAFAATMQANSYADLLRPDPERGRHFEGRAGCRRAGERRGAAAVGG